MDSSLKRNPIQHFRETTQIELFEAMRSLESRRVREKGKGGEKRRKRDDIKDCIKKLLEDDTLTPNFFINGLSPLVVAARMPTEPWLLEVLLQHG